MLSFGLTYFSSGRDAAAAENLASAVGGLHVLRVLRAFVAVLVVLEERLVRVVALDQAAAGRVVVRDGQQQRRAFGERELRLHQALAERVLAQDPGAVVILQRAGDDLRRRRRLAVHQHHDRILLRQRIGLGAEDLLLLGAAAVRHHGLPVPQEAAGQAHGLGHQSAEIVPQIEDQPLHVLLAEFLHERLDVAADVLRFEAGHAEVDDSGPHPEGVHHAGLDAAARDRRGEGLGRAFALHADLHLRALGSAQQLRDRRRIHRARCPCHPPRQSRRRAACRRSMPAS